MERTVLREIIPDESRLVFDHIPPEFLSDTLGRRKGEASALVFAKSTEEVSKLLQYAHANRIPVTPRGAGTNLVGSTVPVDGGIILDLSQMNRILELDTETMTITVEPGLLLQDLQSYVEEHNLFYPPDPGEKASSIGGNISTNAGGMRAVKYGVTRDYVRGLEVVTADGTVLTVGGKNVKDASGLSLKHLYIGSEGTLAVITKCILKVIPKPETSLSILVPYPDLTTGIGSVLNILRADANPTAVEFMERNVVRVGEDFSGVRYPCPEAGSYILLTFDGREREVAASAERIQALALSSGGSSSLSGEEACGRTGLRPCGITGTAGSSSSSSGGGLMNEAVLSASAATSMPRLFRMRTASPASTVSMASRTCSVPVMKPGSSDWSEYSRARSKMCLVRGVNPCTGESCCRLRRNTARYFSRSTPASVRRRLAVLSVTQSMASRTCSLPI